MATKPGMVPEDACWLVLHQISTIEFVGETKSQCLDWIIKKREAGSDLTYIIFSPDSLHEAEFRNRIAWERNS